MGLWASATHYGRACGIGAFLLFGSALAANADVLHAVYSVSLIGLPIGTAKVTANVTSSTYAVDASARLSGLATMVNNSRGASSGKGAIVAGHVAPASFATVATSANMTRTIRMALSGNTVSGIDIDPPFDDKPDRVPLTDKDKRGVVDPVGAFILPAPAGAPTSPAACNRSIPIFDGYTRFNVDLTYVGQRDVSAKGYSGPVAICAARYVPIAGYRRDRPATKFMMENKDIEVWLAPVGGSKVLMPFRISLRTMIGIAVAEASEFSVGEK
jgi:hypothetical protein